MKSEKNIPLWKLGLFIVLLWILSTIIIKYFFSDWSESATFGDTFGAINSLFSGLALTGIIYTIYLQKTELSLQREELKYTREELKRTADAQESSNKMMNEQLRINSFPLIDYHSENTFNDGVKIKILNQSNNPAFDLDIWLLLPIDEEKLSFQKFISESVSLWAKKEIKLSKEKLVDGVNWSICDRGTYNYLANNRAISISLKKYLPVEANFVELFIQYRDFSGNNYYKHMSLVKSQYSNSPYFDDGIKPITPEVTKRFDLLKSPSKESKEKYNEVISLFNASINASYIQSIEEIAFNSLEKNWELVNWSHKQKS